MMEKSVRMQLVEVVKGVLSRETFMAGVVAAAAFVLYLPTLGNSFLAWDDDAYVLSNPYIHSLGPRLLRFAFASFYAANWHPLTWLSHAIDYAVWGPRAFGHHLTNVVVHALNAFLFILLAKRLVVAAKGERGAQADPSTGDCTATMGAFFAGMLFAIHPQRVESVAWVAERKDLLCAFFFLAALLVYTEFVSRGVSRDRWRSFRWLAGTFVLFACALMSKPMAVSLPLVLLLLDWYPFERIRTLRDSVSVFLEKVPFFVASALSCVVTVAAQASGGAFGGGLAFSKRLAVAVYALVAYLRSAVLPADLLPFYSYPAEAAVMRGRYLASLLVLLGLTLAAVLAARRQKLWLAAWLYYLVTVGPVLGLVQVGGQAMADRYAYLPTLSGFLLAGICIVRGWQVLGVSSRQFFPRRATLAGVLALGVLGLALATNRLEHAWKDDVTLWSYAIEKNPEEALVAYYSRALALTRRGRYLEAIADYNALIRLNDLEFTRAHVNRGMLYLQVGRPDLATADFERACQLGDAFGCNALVLTRGRKDVPLPY